MNVRIDLNEPKILAKVQNDRFGNFVSQSWKRLIDPYTPRDTGVLQDTAQIQPYSSAVYYMKNAKFQKKNPYSTYEWDKAAANAGQKDKLIRTINAALQSGQYR